MKSANAHDSPEWGGSRGLTSVHHGGVPNQLTERKSKMWKPVQIAEISVNEAELTTQSGKKFRLVHMGEGDWAVHDSEGKELTKPDMRCANLDGCILFVKALPDA